MAVGNTVAAIEAGAQCASVTVNGLGERAGNAALEEVVMALRIGLQIETGIDSRRFSDLSRLVAEASGRLVPWAKPVTGKGAFLHESGIHCAGLLRDRSAYEAFGSCEVGQATEDFIIGSHSGSAAVGAACLRAGIDCNAAELPALVRRVRETSRRNKKPVSIPELRALAQETA
jgi:homocitrate synthase NifV